MSTPAASLAGHGVAYAREIAEAARDHGIDATLLAAVAAQETGGPDTSAGHNEIGDGGHGHGLFQIDDRYHRFATTAAAMDPKSNAEYAAGMLSGLISRYRSVRRALNAYNAGDPNARGTTTRWGDGQVLGYADSVMRHYARITGAPQDPQDVARDNLPAAVGSITSLASCASSFPSLSTPPAAHVRSYRDVVGLGDGGQSRDGSTDDTTDDDV